MEAFRKHSESTKVGDPFDESSFIGALVSQTQFDRVMGYIKSGKDEGAKIETGGERHGKEGYFVQPTVFSNVKPSMKIMDEEIFGPVVCIAKFDTLEDVIKVGNDTMYGLAASVHTKSLENAINTSNRLQAGTVWINCHNMISYQVPFG